MCVYTHMYVHIHIYAWGEIWLSCWRIIVDDAFLLPALKRGVHRITRILQCADADDAK
jgi:hypothetical protein